MRVVTPMTCIIHVVDLSKMDRFQYTIYIYVSLVCRVETIDAT